MLWMDGIAPRFDALDRLIGVDCHDQDISQSFGREQVPQMPHVQKLKASVGENDFLAVLLMSGKNGNQPLRV